MTNVTALRAGPPYHAVMEAAALPGVGDFGIKMKNYCGLGVQCEQSCLIPLCNSLPCLNFYRLEARFFS